MILITGKAVSQNLNKNIRSGFMSTFVPCPHHCFSNTISEEENGWHSLKFQLNQGIKKVDAIGTGCMLIDMNVFKIIEWPWFEYEYTTFQGKHDRISEDMVFCKKCMVAGIPIYADTDIKCGHFLSAQVIPTNEGGYEVKTMAGDGL